MRRPEEYTSTKKKIIEAALNIISNEGLCNVTIRKLASLAGVNVAAINYHFGSKEQLINQALLSITEQLENSFEVLKNEDLLPEERLKYFLDGYTNTMLTYPVIIKNFIMQSITEYQISGEYEAFIKEQGYDLIKNTLKQIRPEDSETIVEMRIMQLFGGLAFPVLVANRTIALKDFDYSHEDVRSQYIDIMMKYICR
ncbi:transcriptional regulator, tetr family [hydrocarbon metagenome]|uniref:Transcriptional regulator, tetr family n=1 Tax=hydrocarbon metagenome TaxID=938273 RepID=A0A0W8E984_9ZZZZ